MDDAGTDSWLEEHVIVRGGICSPWIQGRSLALAYQLLLCRLPLVLSICLTRRRARRWKTSSGGTSVIVVIIFRWRRLVCLASGSVTRDIEVEVDSLQAISQCQPKSRL